jgi:tetratricopeptide (TPR) repeat protein
MSEVLRAVASQYQWEDYLPTAIEAISVDSATLDAYVGRFQVNPDRVLTVTKEKDMLFGEPTQGPKVKLFAVSDGSFIRNDAIVQYSFVRNAAEKVDSIKIRFDGRESIAPRISEGTLIPYELLMAGKIDEAIEAYRKIKKEKPANVVVEENRLNGLGYFLLQEKRLAEAIAVFKLNVELYPRSSNVYDSLGEAYMTAGDKELAIQNYKKSLELDPKNKNAASNLKKLQP